MILCCKSTDPDLHERGNAHSGLSTLYSYESFSDSSYNFWTCKIFMPILSVFFRPWDSMTLPWSLFRSTIVGPNLRRVQCSSYVVWCATSSESNAIWCIRRFVRTELHYLNVLQILAVSCCVYFGHRFCWRFQVQDSPSGRQSYLATGCSRGLRCLPGQLWSWGEWVTCNLSNRLLSPGWRLWLCHSICSTDRQQ